MIYKMSPDAMQAVKAVYYLVLDYIVVFFHRFVKSTVEPMKQMAH